MAEKRRLNFGDTHQSVSKSARNSRLPVDTRRTSALRSSSSTRRRSRSAEEAADRLGPLRRFGSACSLMDTPQQHRMTPGMATPLMSLRRSTMVSSERGRRENNDNNCKQITEILERDRDFYAQLNLQADLKSMTAKQFLQIMTYFIQIIGGKALVSKKEFQADPLNGIVKFLKDLGCPYMVTKSAMKTPNAPHTFDQLVTLMLWLSDYAGEDDSLESGASFSCDKDFPNDKFTAIFSRQIETNYCLYDDAEDYERLKAELIDAFIVAKTNGQVKSVIETKRVTDSLRQRIEHMEKTPYPMANEKQYEAMQSQHLKHDGDEHQLNENILRKQDQLAAIALKWSNRIEEVQRKEAHVAQMQMKVDTQSKCVAEFKKALDKRTHLRISLEERRTEIEKVNALNAAKEVRSARLQSQKAQSIADYNVHIMQVCQLLSRCNIGVQIDPNNLSVDLQTPLATLKTIDHEITAINRAASKHKVVLQVEIEKLKNQVDCLNQHEQTMNGQLTDSRNAMKKLMKELKAEEMRQLNANLTHDKNVAECTAKLEQLKTELAAEQHIVADTGAKLEELRKKNEELMAEFEAKSNKLMDQKQRIVDQMDITLESLTERQRMLESENDQPKL